jgi:hypothetical protein
VTSTTWASIIVSAAAVLTPLTVAPAASADGACPSGVAGTVCQSTAGPDVVATPPQVSDGAQNGPYGPAGDTAPVGGNGL